MRTYGDRLPTGRMATREDGEVEVHAHFSASTVVEDKVVTLGGASHPREISLWSR